jgi:hypothetical protein
MRPFRIEISSGSAQRGRIPSELIVDVRSAQFASKDIGGEFFASAHRPSARDAGAYGSDEPRNVGTLFAQSDGSETGKQFRESLCAVR